MTAEKVTKKNHQNWTEKKYCSQPYRLISKRNPILYIFMFNSLHEKKIIIFDGSTLKIFTFYQPYPLSIFFGFRIFLYYMLDNMYQ